MSYCTWDDTSDINRRYHDHEWGVPVHRDRKQFEYLMMEVMQCGLNWDMMMKKREIFRACFDRFDYERIACYTDADILRIMNTPGMIRSPRKIKAVITNARCFRQIRQEFGSFCKYLWAYTGNKTVIYDKHPQGYIPVSNGLSAQISADLKQRGFKYLGPVTMYSHLQAAGLINDHDPHCPRHHYINTHYPTVHQKRWREKGVRYFGE